MTTHDLKTWPEYFVEVAEERKTFEIRANDRDYKVGDVLRLREWVSSNGGYYTGRETSRLVTYITDFAQKPGFVVMAIKQL